LIRNVFRFGLASELSILPRLPDRLSATRFFATTLLFLTPCPGVALAASPLPPHGIVTRPGDDLTFGPDHGRTNGSRRGVELSENAPIKSEAAEAWDAVKDTKNPALLEAFIQRYGTTFFAEIAKSRLEQLKAAATGPSPADTAKTIRTEPIHQGQQTPPDSSRQSPVQMPTEGMQQRAVLYEEDPADPAGQRTVGAVFWRTESIKTEGKPDELAVHADIDVPSRGLQMTMRLRRNLDPSLPASHIIDLTFRLPADFAGGGIANVPGILTKSNEQARGVALAGLSVKVAGGAFMVGLSNVAADRERNHDLLLQRAWLDIPLVYVNQRRGILAIDKGETGEQVFRTVFKAWGQYPGESQPAAGVPDSGNGGAR
jgi:hypothetical protein